MGSPPFGKSNGKDGRVATARLGGLGSKSRGESRIQAQWGWGWKGPQSRIQLSTRWSPLKCWVDKNDKQGHQIGSKFKQVPLAGRWIMSYSIPQGDGPSRRPNRNRVGHKMGKRDQRPRWFRDYLVRPPSLSPQLRSSNIPSCHSRSHFHPASIFIFDASNPSSKL